MNAGKVKKFVFDLYKESHAIRDGLLGHPRFRWTSIDQKKLTDDGKNDAKAKSELLPTIVRSSENEVLGIIHRYFVAQKWIARAKVFAGLIPEPTKSPTKAPTKATTVSPGTPTKAPLSPTPGPTDSAAGTSKAYAAFFIPAAIVLMQQFIGL